MGTTHICKRGGGCHGTISDSCLRGRERGWWLRHLPLALASEGMWVGRVSLTPARVCAGGGAVVMVMMEEVGGPGPHPLRLAFARGRWWAEVVGGGSVILMGR